MNWLDWLLVVGVVIFMATIFYLIDNFGGED